MTTPTVTRDFVRSLARNIRERCGKEVSHTEAIEIVATSLGWRPDALMHTLKNAAPDHPGHDAPDDVPDDTLRLWVLRRSWRRAEMAILRCMPVIHSDNDRALASACLAVCHVSLGNSNDAARIMHDVFSPEPLVDGVRALAMLKAEGDPVMVGELLGRAAPKLIELFFDREVEGGQDRLGLGDYGEIIAMLEEGGRAGRWLMHLEWLLSHLTERDFLMLNAAMMKSPGAIWAMKERLDQT